MTLAHELNQGRFFLNGSSEMVTQDPNEMAKYADSFSPFHAGFLPGLLNRRLFARKVS